MKKILFSFFIIVIIIILFFLATNHFSHYLASLFNVITAWVTINPLEVDVSAPAEVEIDKVFQVEAKIMNKGEEKIENGKAEIILTSGLVLLKKEPVREIGVIPGKKEKKISWAVKGIEIGIHIIAVSVSGELKGDLVSTEDSKKVEVKESIPPGWRHRFDFLKRFFDFF